MNPTILLALQAFLVFAQFINLGLALVPAWAKPEAQLIIGAAVAGLSFFVQHVGNQATPKEVQEALDMLRRKDA